LPLFFGPSSLAIEEAHWPSLTKDVYTESFCVGVV